ncbi:DUF3617 family protein [Chelatococcus sambhunathii]|uniref:DUF3617 family protein n=1 Tax=Chelatococcus sambhunathii TaxID=363953 RepID=A0ABU1DJF2_9HYPH|nr:DUF3617 family protein [Chelatococcus sambhunathii]MDR4308236.1 DUF3617 family protein [Chelatococcus sambhunathii]
MQLRWTALSTAALCACAASASAQENIPSGAYEVTYSLELPHVAPTQSNTAKVCVTENHAFPVLSANNPLARCPASDIRRQGREVSFRIVCAGPNAAKADALFDLRDDGFDGRIAMNMGGKNMTMTEVQHGRRVGDCAAGDTTR